MTAESWWRRFYANWMARIDAVQNHIGLGFQGITAAGIGAGALKYYGLQQFAPVFLAVLVLGTLAYAKWYTDGGVWNQVGRDRQDMSNNFSDPDKLINYQIIARQNAMIAHELQRDEPRDYEEIVADMQAESTEEWKKLRDGVDLEALQ